METKLVNAIQNIPLISSSVICGFFIVKIVLKGFSIFLREIKEAETAPIIYSSYAQNTVNPLTLIPSETKGGELTITKPLT